MSLSASRSPHCRGPQLRSKPGANPHLSVEHAADLLFGLLSPEFYLLFIRDRGWTRDRWEQWVYDTLRAQLCDSA